MKFVVVDASVVAKWYVPEIHTISALKLLDGTFGLCAPDLLPSELGNILWKKVQRGEIGQERAEEIIADYETAPITYYSSLSLTFRCI